MYKHIHTREKEKYPTIQKEKKNEK